MGGGGEGASKGWPMGLNASRKFARVVKLLYKLEIQGFMWELRKVKAISTGVQIMSYFASFYCQQIISHPVHFHLVQKLFLACGFESKSNHQTFFSLFYIET